MVMACSSAHPSSDNRWGHDLGNEAHKADTGADTGLACRFTANPSGNNRRGRDLDDEAHEAKERTKGWFGSKKEQAEDTAEDAKVGNTRHMMG